MGREKEGLSVETTACDLQDGGATRENVEGVLVQLLRLVVEQSQRHMHLQHAHASFECSILDLQ